MSTPTKTPLLTLGKAWDRFDKFTDLASSSVRQLCYAGIGAVWAIATFVFESNSMEIGALLVAAGFFVAALLLNLIQYAWSSFYWYWRPRIFEMRKQNKDKLDLDAEIKHSALMDVPSVFLFWMKFFACLAACWFLMTGLVEVSAALEVDLGEIEFPFFGGGDVEQAGDQVLETPESPAPAPQ